MTKLLANGAAVRKVQGIPFGGVPCAKCGHTEYARTNGEIDEGRRVSAKHPEGWSHIFDPAQLEVVDDADTAHPEPATDQFAKNANCSKPTADAPGEARQRLLSLAECRDLSAVYGSEWCSDRAEQFSTDIRAALRPQSPDAVALLRAICACRDEERTVWIISDLNRLRPRIDQFLQSEGA